MSDEEKPLEFSARDLMPDWAQEKPQAPATDYSKRFADESRGSRDHRDRRDSRDRRDFRGGGRGDRQDRFVPRGERREHGAPRGPGDRDRPRGDRPRDDRGGGPRRDRHPREGRDDRSRDDRPRELPSLTGITATLEPSGPAVEGLTKHIRETFRSFPLADLAKMILEARERYQVRFTAAEPAVLYQCQADGSVWLSREEATAHLLSGPALEVYYQAEDVVLDPPSGNYSTIAVCGFSGVILGPPNHHEYQRNIARLHRERFSDMSLERFKSRIRMETGEEILEKWKEAVSRVRQYRVKPAPVPASPTGPGESEAVPLDIEAEAAAEASSAETSAEVAGDPVAEETTDASAPDPVAEEPVAEEPVAKEPVAGEAAPESEIPDDGSGVSGENEASDEGEAEGSSVAPAAPGPAFKNLEEVARHFRQHHADEAIAETRMAVVPGNIPGRLLSPALLSLLKGEGEKLRRGFPLPLIQALCQAFEQKGLKFFKRGKKSLHVAAIRPRALDENVALTESIGKIIDYVKATPKATVAGLLETLVPGFQHDGPMVEESAEWSDAARAVLKDLRWLTAEGYVLEFPDTGLAMGRPPQGPGTAPPVSAAKAPAEGKARKPKKEATSAATAATATATPAATGAPGSSIPSGESVGAFDEDLDGFGDGFDLLVDTGSDPDEPDPLPEDVNPVDTF